MSCILWTKSKNSSGYGNLSYKGRPALAHRVAYVEANGICLEDIADKVVRHTCDNRLCVNPDHLLLGTHADNARDMSDRNRASDRTGSKHHLTKLTENDVVSIRERYSPGCSTNGASAMSREFGITKKSIHRILSRETWRHI